MLLNPHRTVSCVYVAKALVRQFINPDYTIAIDGPRQKREINSCGSMEGSDRDRDLIYTRKEAWKEPASSRPAG